MLRHDDLIAVCVHNLPLVILIMVSSLHQNITNQNSFVNIRVLYYISSICIIKICLIDWDSYFFLLKFTKFVLIYVSVLQDSCNLEDDRGVGVNIQLLMVRDCCGGGIIIEDLWRI